MAHLLPGPLATMYLADMGAEVIIVEGVSQPDRTRRFPGHFEALNRDKKAICLDLKSAEGKAIFLRLAATADVVMEGFRPGVVERLGLAASDIAKVKPDIVYVSISAYGQTGPNRLLGAHDLSIQANAGALTPAGENNSLPEPTALPLADLASAMSAIIAVCAGLFRRERTNEGTVADVAMLDSLVAWMTPFVGPKMLGQQAANLPPKDPGYGVFHTADERLITLSISGEDHLWDAMCSVLDLPSLAGVPEKNRIADRKRMIALLADAIALLDYAELESRFTAAQVPFSPVLSFDDVANDAGLQERNMFAAPIGSAGTPRYVRQPIAFDGMHPDSLRPAPRIGEDSRDILLDLGLAPEEIETLTREGKIIVADDCGISVG